MSDQSALTQQLHEQAKALRITISSAKASGADRGLIYMAEEALVRVVRYTREAIDMGMQSRGGRG